MHHTCRIVCVETQTILQNTCASEAHSFRKKLECVILWWFVFCLKTNSGVNLVQFDVNLMGSKVLCCQYLSLIILMFSSTQGQSIDTWSRDLSFSIWPWISKDLHCILEVYTIGMEETEIRGSIFMRICSNWINSCMLGINLTQNINLKDRLPYFLFLCKGRNGY